MNKFLCCLGFFLLFISCSKSNKKTEPVIKSIDYAELNSFIQDSLPILSNLDPNYNQVFNLWQDIDVLIKTSMMPKSDPRQLRFFIESYKLEIDKINEIHIPQVLNIPSVIGRFRVFKTEILKTKTNTLNQKNLQLFKYSLNKIFDSYNILISKMNVVAKESIESKKE